MLIASGVSDEQQAQMKALVAMAGGLGVLQLRYKCMQSMCGIVLAMLRQVVATAFRWVLACSCQHTLL